MSYMQTTDQPFKKAICLSAVNHGPIEATLKMGILKSAHFGLLNTRFAEHAILKPHTSFPYNMEDFHPFGGGLPKKLAVGEEFSVYLSSKLNWPKRYHVLVGFVDTFGRNHFASKKNFVSTISQQETMKNNV